MAGRLQALPDEVLVRLMGGLPVQSLICLQATCKELGQLTRSDSLWKKVAVGKWGDLASEQSAAGTWFEYCRARLSFRAVAPSPFALIQERYVDPWQHLVCCLCCCRTSGSEVVATAIEDLLAAFPTPSAVVGADEALLKAALRPVGLQDSRCKALQRMSRDFLLRAWEDPSEFYGCGKFVSDSWSVFCVGNACAKAVEDVNLKRYLHWRNTGESQAKARAPKREGKVNAGRAKRPVAPGPSASGAAKRVLRSTDRGAATAGAAEGGRSLRRSTRQLATSRH
mmetsp:Transcript_31193/g.80080  ORF Transcript_31193/g.80080 Transcript_31193/m.80080 type:complete len:282 (-) Transcript_31193:32-877(-)|eukprot:jgi/Tetstr1/431916/TSEL_021405.t1